MVSEKNGTWDKAEPVPGLAAIDRDMASDNALSCGSPGNCVIAGSCDNEKQYPPGLRRHPGQGVWGRVLTFPAIAAAATQGAGIGTLSCRPGGTCTGTGTWYNSGIVPHVFAISQTRGTWGAARPDYGLRGPARRPGVPRRGHLSVLSGGRQLHPRRLVHRQGRW